MSTDTFDQIVSLNQSTSGGVDQDHAVFHLLDGLAVDQVIGVVHQRAVQGDQITLCQQFVQRYVSNEIFDGWILKHIIGDDVHTKTVADSCHSSTDLTSTNDTCGLAVEVHTHQSAKAEVILTNLYISFVKMTVNCQSQSHCVLSNCFRRIARNTEYTDAKTFCSLHLYIVESCTAEKDQFNTAHVQNFNGIVADICTYECTYSIIAMSKLSSKRCQLSFQKLYFDVRVIYQLFGKRLFIITFGIKENNFHYRYLLEM